MKKLFKKLIIWAFRDRIIVMYSSKTVQDVELVLTKYPVWNDVKEEIALRIAHKMVETNLMEFDQRQDIVGISRTIVGKVYVLKV